MITIFFHFTADLGNGYGGDHMEPRQEVGNGIVEEGKCRMLFACTVKCVNNDLLCNHVCRMFYTMFMWESNFGGWKYTVLSRELFNTFREGACNRRLNCTKYLPLAYISKVNTACVTSFRM